MTYAVCIIWTIAVALWAACDDAEQIALSERIHHGRQWLIRAALVFLVCLCAGLPLFAIPMGALFSMVFRFTLNKLREKDWRYVSPSSWYDWQFLRLCGFVNRNAQMEHWGRSYRTYHGWWRKQVHRAGLLAYIAEAVVVLIFALFV